jgi:Fe-S-cluster containining protein
MRDGPLRRAVKRIARAWQFANLYPTRLWLRAQGEPSFRLGGACHLCAKCCEAPSIQVRPLTFRLKTLRRPFLWWQRRVNQFELVDEDPKQKVFVFRCGHFDPQTRRCDSYDSRPAMCRDYPRNLLYHPAPDFLEGCGYFAINKKRDRIAELLASEEIAPDKRDAIEKVFHLREEEDSRPDAQNDSPESPST